MQPSGTGWTLIARFSNNDIKHWMNDSGYWWYDAIEAVGDTSDPLANADMISPAFWLISGNEFRITRSDDSHHTSLLQTTSDCLGGQTFRSKVTSYGDFRYDTVVSSSQCEADCNVQFGGQYDTTQGFKQASCNGSMQSFHNIGFWCRYGYSGSVMMIGGGGNGCDAGGHGLGVTASKSGYFVSNGRPEDDFADKQWSTGTKAYALNLWVRSHP